MKAIYSRCAGLDVHKDTVVGCVLIAEDHKVRKEIRTFGTMTGDLLKLADWLKKNGVTHVAMESTGVYWVPIYNILEGPFELLVVNAQHIKNVPGRKTDVKDCEWIADLLRHGLLRGSFIPPKPQRQLRELVRHRANLIERRAKSINELHKCLESTNLKLGSVVTSLAGVSATEILMELVNGRTNPEKLADLARGRLQEKKPELEKALKGKVEPHHRLIIKQLLADMAWCEERIEEVSQEIARRLQEQSELMARLDEIPGVNRRTAEVILAEVGSTLERFPTDRHLVSWAGLCPGNNESAGKRRSGRIRPGNRSLRQALVEAANGAARKKKSYLSALYHRLSARRGRKRALIAVARTILQIVYFMIKRGSRFLELGELYFDQRNASAITKRLTRRIERLGFQVVLQPAAT